MDVLELPKPVINFLRTMSSEREKYLLTWDLYGDGNSVTLSLTWKLANDNNQNESETKQTNSTQKSSSNINNINTTTFNNNKSENQINMNKSIKKLNDVNIIPPPSAASLIANKTIPDHKDTKTVSFINPDRYNTSSKTHVIKSKSKDHNYYKIDNNNDNYNNQNNPKTSASLSSCLYFPVSSKKNNKADIYRKNKSFKKQSSDNRNKKKFNRIKSNSETNLNEDYSSSSESCEECKNYSPLFHNDFTYRIVDYNLKSPVYKYKDARSIQNLNTYKEDNEEDKVEQFIIKSPWIKNKNSKI
jgi:hypothetical protein